MAPGLVEVAQQPCSVPAPVLQPAKLISPPSPWSVLPISAPAPSQSEQLEQLVHFSPPRRHSPHPPLSYQLHCSLFPVSLNPLSVPPYLKLAALGSPAPEAEA